MELIFEYDIPNAAAFNVNSDKSKIGQMDYKTMSIQKKCNNIENISYNDSINMKLTKQIVVIKTRRRLL